MEDFEKQTEQSKNYYEEIVDAHEIGETEQPEEVVVITKID